MHMSAVYMLVMYMRLAYDTVGVDYGTVVDTGGWIVSEHCAIKNVL